MNFDHRFYGSTSCCIRHWPCQWEMVMFDLPRLPDPLIDEIHNHPIIVLYMQNVMVDLGCLGKLPVSRMKVSALVFFIHVQSSHLWTHPHA